MTEAEKDQLVDDIADCAVGAVGAMEAPGVLWAALITAHLKHHSLESAVICIETGLRELRQDFAKTLRPKGSTQ